MGRRIEPINAVAYALFHLRGGWKHLALLMLVGLLAAGAVSAGILAQAPQHARQTAQDAVMLLLTGQWLLLTFGGFYRVAAGIRADMTSGLIESHRLSPDPPLAAVAGYIVGGAAQILAVAVVGFVTGGALAVYAGLPVSFWLVFNGMALATALMLWAFAAMVNFGSTATGLSVLFGVLGVFGTMLVGVVPAMTVICAPVNGRHLWQGWVGAGLPVAFVFTLAADVLLGGVFALAAARQYRSSVTDAFNVRLALLLLVIWTAITVVGLAATDEFQAARSNATVEPGVRTVAAILSGMLVAFIPAAAIARRWTRPSDSYSPGHAPRHPVLTLWLLPACVALVCAATFVGTDWQVDNQLPLRRWMTAAIVGLTVLSVAALTAWQDLIGKSARAVTTTWLLLTNLVPPFVQVLTSVRHTAEPTEAGDAIYYAPVVALFAIWDSAPADATAGIRGQAISTALPLLLLVMRLAHTRRRSASALTTLTALAK